MSDEHDNQQQDPVGESWTWLVQAVAGVLVLLGTGVVIDYYAPPRDTELKQQVRELHAQVEQLKQEQDMPTNVLTRYRNSICYIYGVYEVGFPQQPPRLRARVSGTGFIVGKGLLATNRHVAEPWYGDPEADALIRRGAQPSLEKLVAFFPGSPTPLEIIPTVVSSNNDLAIL